MKDVNNYQTERSCEYRGERYLVRDNGAVFRCSRDGKKRRLDEQWTFGVEKADAKYLRISSALVHQIVATAFHGPAPADYYVVDHIDEDRQNNRPENLRWTTKRGNILENPITVRKIEHICGSAEAFLDDPASFYHLFPKTKKSDAGESKGEKLYRSLTKTAKQRNWKMPALFPCCPLDIREDALQVYFNQMKEDKPFSATMYKDEKRVFLIGIFEKVGKQIVVLSYSSNPYTGNPFAVAKVSFENGFYIHESIGTWPEIDMAIVFYLHECKKAAKDSVAGLTQSQ